MNILLLNAHSALNLGDEGIMRATLQGLETVYPGAHITIAANDPKSWLKFKNVEVVSSLCHWVANCRLGNWRGSLRKTPFYLALLFLYAIAYKLFGLKLLFGSQEKKNLLASFYNADLILSCGGGNLYANHSRSPSFFWHLITLLFPMGLGKKVVLLPQSVGPINGRLLQILTRYILAQIPVIMVREPISSNYIKHSLKLSNPVKIVPDIAFSLSGKLDNEIEFPFEPNDDLKIGITVIDRGLQTKNFQGQTNYENIITKLLISLIENHKAQIYIFVQVYGPSYDQDDRHISQQIYQRLRVASDRVHLINNLSTAMEAKAAYTQMDCMIATRMHTAIFALSDNIPVVLIGYQPKSQGMLELLGLDEYYLNIDTLTEEKLFSLVEKAVNNHDRIKQIISKSNEQMELTSYKWTSYLHPQP